jgi:biopolymer transport protein ExbD
MKLRRKPKEEAEVASEALNDIMFFLLLFFLIIATLVNPNVIKMMVPGASNTKRPPMNKVVTVSLDDSNGYYVDGRPVADVTKLESALVSELRGMKDPTVVLRVSNERELQELVDVMQLGEKLEIKMVLAAPPPSSK